MPVYDDPEQKTKVEADELRRITGIGRGEEDAMDTAARQGAEADAAEKDKLSTIGGGYNAHDTSKSASSKITGRFSRKKLIGGGAVGGIIAVIALLATVISGPSQFIHISELLQQFHFGNNSRFMADRDRNLFTHMRNYATGDRHMSNLGYSANKVADRYEKRLADVGIKPIYENVGRSTGSIQFLEVDGNTPEGKKVIEKARRSGIDIPDAPDGKHVIKLRGDDGAKQARTLLRASLDSLEDLGKLNSAIAKRLLIKRGGVSLHQLSANKAREKGQTLADYYRARREERAEERAQGSSEIDIEVPDAETTTDAEGNAVTDPIADQASQEAGEIVEDVASVDVLDADAVSKIAQIKNSLLVKGAGTAVAVVGVMCTVRSLGDQAENLQYTKIILPMLRIGMEFVSIGAQVKSGIDVNSEQLGSIAADLYDTSKDIPKNARSFWSAKSLQAEQGKPQTGPDLDESLQPGQVEGKPIWLATLDAVPGLSQACGVSDLVQGLPVIKQVGELSNAVISRATGGILDRAIGMLINVMAGDVEIVNAKGAELGNIANYGTLLAANDSAISMGGRALGTAEVATLDKNRKQEDLQEFQQKSFATRIFDIHEKDSLAAKTLLENPDLAQPTSAVASFFTAPTRILSNLGSITTKLFTPGLSAEETPYSYGVDEYGFSQQEMDDPAYENPFANADIVEPQLKDLNDKYGGCFGTTISTDGKIQTKETVKYSATTVCNDSKDPMLVRYRFYIADTIAMTTMSCYELSVGCAELGLEGGTSTTAGSGIAGVEMPPNLGPEEQNGYYLMPEATNGEYIFSTGSNHYGSKELVGAIYTVAKKWHEKYPTSRVRIGDLNARGGHLSHTTGVDVDITTEDTSAANTGGNAEMSKELARMFADTGIVELIYYNDKAVQDDFNAYAKSKGLPATMESWSGHDNHFHVRVLDDYKLQAGGQP